MWQWLYKIDPNTVVFVLSIAGSYVWSKLSGRTRETVEKAIDAVIDNFVLEFLAREPHDTVELQGYIARARTFIEVRVWPVLQKRGVPKNATTVRLLDAAIERGTAALRREIEQRRKAREQP